MDYIYVVGNVAVQFLIVLHKMGAAFRKCNCGGCFRRENRVIPMPNGLESGMMTEEDRQHEEIVNELQSLGLIRTKPGGSTFNIVGVAPGRRPPNRLPVLPAIPVAPKDTKEETHYTKAELRMMVEIRRQGILEDKGKMGREYDERRKSVMKRREEKILKKIRKTEAKLRRGEMKVNEMKKNTACKNAVEKAP